MARIVALVSVVVYMHICLSAQPKSRQILAASHTWSKGWSSRIQGDEIKELYRCGLHSLREEFAFKKKRVAEAKGETPTQALGPKQPQT